MDQTETPQDTIKRQAEKLTQIYEKLQGLSECINTDLAVQVLEYNDKNLLTGDNKTRSEDRLNRLDWCSRRVSEIKELTQ